MAIRPEKWGPLLWGALHVSALSCTDRRNFVNFVEAYKGIIPCMACKKHFEDVLINNPVSMTNLFEWSVDVHNMVNERIGKSLMTYEQAYEKWTSDGSSNWTQMGLFILIVVLVIFMFV